ncbi:MAG: hypothetical protein IH587_11610, partial [Anaerolineae bacterium]|nr:hypothetical protein [Anaerolineae bacterium]
FKTVLPSILKKYVVDHDDIVIDDARYEIAYNSPKGHTKEQVIDTLQLITSPQGSVTNLRITTFHNAKGEAFDSVLIVSAETKAQGGHWEEWLDPTRADGEHSRLAYVASSRPRNLLAWAVPRVRNQDYSPLLNLGFVLVDDET